MYRTRIGVCSCHMKIAGAVLAAAAIAAVLLLGQGHLDNHPGTPIAPDHPELRPAMQLLRDGNTGEARRELERLLSKNSDDAELNFQLARSYLLDFYGSGDPVAARTSLALAVE